MIQTVLGKITPEELGICSAHEHLSIDLSRVKKIRIRFWMMNRACMRNWRISIVSAEGPWLK